MGNGLAHGDTHTKEEIGHRITSAAEAGVTPGSLSGDPGVPGGAASAGTWPNGQAAARAPGGKQRQT
jgi:hypothetical protein